MLIITEIKVRFLRKSHCWLTVHNDFFISLLWQNVRITTLL